MANQQSVTRMWVHGIAGELGTTAVVLLCAAVTPVNPIWKWTFIA